MKEVRGLVFGNINICGRLAVGVQLMERMLKHKLEIDKDVIGNDMTTAEQLIYMARVKSFTDAQLKEEFEKIQKAISNIQIQAFSRTLKRIGPVLEKPSSKRQKSTEAPILTLPDVPQSPVVSSPPSSGTRRNSLGRKRLPKPKSTLQKLDLDADAQTFINCFY
uniref:Uncharacterized protein n=1 Tax=Tanacetum cinerariifolium TaxID=118510 RepID=A0A699RNC3_TANCI|nr:hypothetical protein [Tanacetum cinerariifolium]